MTTLTIEQQIAELLGTTAVTPVEDIPSEKMITRSKYLGVYNNTGKNADKFSFRAAICLWKGTDRQRWINLGYFNCEHTAATAYNVASVNYFNGKGMLNPVNKEARDTVEHTTYLEKREEYVNKAAAKVRANATNGIETRLWEIRA